MQGSVSVGRDAGQVVAGNAVTNIENFHSIGPRFGSMLLAFFWAR